MTIRTVRKPDEGPAIDALLLAFSTDPVARHTWPEPNQYMQHFPAFARAFGGNAFTHGSAHINDEGTAAALWLPPDVQPDDEAMGALMESSVDKKILGEAAAVMEQMGQYHPSEPHWYLPLIGVDPAHQGKGHGSALLEHALVACDRDRVLAYLESTNPKNVPLYQRHGFEVLGTIQSGSYPPLVPMLRRPR